jgi:DNA-binding MarR family transcriptional regulator
MKSLDASHTDVTKNATQIADFIMYTQRSFLLDLSRELNKGNVSYAQFFLLGYLSSEEYLTMTDISRKMGHSTAAATGLVDRLEKLGYVQRMHANDDRRKVMVQITKKGMALVQQLRENIVRGVAASMENPNSDEGPALNNALRALQSSKKENALNA